MPPSLEERVTALEGLIAQTPGEETQPTYLTYDPVTGHVSASFTGQLKATGLSLAEGGTIPDAIANRINWVRVSDQTVGELIQGRAVNATTGEAMILAQSGARSDQAALKVTAVDGGATSSVSAVAGGSAPIIIQGNGASNFLRTAALNVSPALPARPVTLADAIAVLVAYGLTA